MILFRSDAASFSNFHCHRAGHDIPGGKIFHGWGVPFHEPFAFRISEHAPFPATPFCHQTPGAVNPGGMELHKFIILIGHSLSERHRIPIPGTGMSRRTTKKGPTEPPRRQDGIFGPDAMQTPIFHIQHQDPDTFRPIVTH